MTAFPGRPAALRRLAFAAAALLASPVWAADLLSAYRQALENDANFLAARANTEAAREAVPQARAGLLPNLSLSASRSKNFTEITQNTIFGPSSSRFDYTAEGQNLTLRQPLFRWANLAQYRQAEAQVAGAEQTLDKERQNLAARVAGAYFDVLAAQDQLRFAAEQKKTYYEQWQRAFVMLDKGAGTRTDRDEAKARYDGVLAQEIDAANAVDIAERTLASITSRPVPAAALAQLDEHRLPLDTPTPASFDEWVTLAERTNPELASLWYAIEASNQEVQKQRSGHFPTLDLIAQRSYSASETVSIIGSRYHTDLFGVQIAIPLFSGGAVLSGERQARAGLERARQQYEAAKRQLTLNLRREFNNVTQGVAKVRALEEAFKSAVLALASTEMGVKAGTRNTLDVLNARQQVFGAQRDLAKGRYDYVVGRLKLKAAAGTLAESDIEMVNRWLSVGGADRGSIPAPALPVVPAAPAASAVSVPVAATVVSVPVVSVPAVSVPVATTVVSIPVATLPLQVSDGEPQVRERVERWRRSWASRDIEAYLGCYSADFVPAGDQTRSNWEKARRRMLSTRSGISVQVNDMRIERIDDDRLKAVFLQDYASGRYREDAQPKTLLLVREGSDWRIAGEWQGKHRAPQPARK